MQRHEALTLCRNLVNRRIRSLEEELDSIFELLEKEEKVAPQSGGAIPFLLTGSIDNPDTDTIVIDNTDLPKKTPQTEQGKALKLTDSLFLTVNPIYNGEDYIDEVAVLFSNTCPDRSFIDFFTGFNFSAVLSGVKYYPLTVIKQIYCSLTNTDPLGFDILRYLNKKEYFKGVIAYKRDNLYAFNVKGITIIQENVRKYAEKSVSLAPVSVPEFLTNVLDLEKVARDNLCFQDLAAIYKDLYGKEIDDRIIRNAMVAKHITVLSVFGDKRPAKGEALAEMLRRYRKVRKKRDAEEENPAAISQKPSSGLQTSIGELVKKKLKL